MLVDSVRSRRKARAAKRAGLAPVAEPAQAAGPAPAVSRPAWVDGAVAGVWDELAPHALAQRTLTPETAEAFGLGCKMVAIERATDPVRHGGSDHRGQVCRVEAFFVRFRLIPTGRELATKTAPREADPLARLVSSPLRRVK